MSKDDPKLQAFPAWAMGQVLLPVQFQALQAALLSHIAVRAELSGAPAHGVARLHLREGVLEREGAIAIERLTYIFRAPAPIIDVPGNTVVSGLNLATYKDQASIAPLSIYLHLLNAVCDGKDQQRYPDDDRSLARELFKAVLSVEPTHDDTRESVKLLELSYGVREGWTLTNYAPPLVRIGGRSSPYLSKVFATTQQNLRVIKGQVQRDIADDFLSREHTSELRRVRGSVNRMLRRLADLGLGDAHSGEVSEHPYLLYRELRDFYVENASNLEHHIEQTGIYEHENLARCFTSINELIAGLERTAALNSNALEFDRSPDYYQIHELPATLATANEVYLIIKFAFTDARPEPGAATKQFLDRFKNASPRRVAEIVTRSLSGVGIALLDETVAAIFSPKFGHDALCCRLDVAHPEWQTALAEGGLSVPIAKGLDNLRLYLVWNDKPKDAASGRGRK